MNYFNSDPATRYKEDPQFHTFVDTVYRLIQSCQMTAHDVVQACNYARVRYETYNADSLIYKQKGE